mmetsp:Transcript_94210/g.239751  ORF Transcript_94210/g.239751 Transcript_94210/m.239751 type:complete len:405 (+) Transcript_94210:155-1369(+)
MWWQGIDLKPTRFPEGDPICAAPGRPAGDRWESQRLLIKAREARSSSGAGTRRAAEREAAARPTRPSSAPALLRGTRLPAGASHEPPPPGRPPKDLALTALRQGIEDSAVRDQLGVYRQAYRTTKDAVNAVDQLADTVLFDLKVLHNKAQRNKSAAAAVVVGRAHEAKKPGLVKVRERRDKSGADKDQCLQARQLKEWAQRMDESTRQTCKSCSVSHRVVQYLAHHTDITINAARLAFVEAAAEVSSEDEMPAIKCKTAMLTLSGAFRSSTNEAQRQTEAFHGASECLQQTAEFLTQRGDMRALLEGMDLLRKGHLLLEDWDLGMHMLGFPEDPLHVWVHLSKGHKHVSIDDMEKSLTPNREDCDQRRSLNKRPSVLASDAEGPSPRARASRTSKKRNALFVTG